MCHMPQSRQACSVREGPQLGSLLGVLSGSLFCFAARNSFLKSECTQCSGANQVYFTPLENKCGKKQ